MCFYWEMHIILRCLLYIPIHCHQVEKVSTKQTKNKYNQPKNSRYILNATGAYIMIKS